MHSRRLPALLLALLLAGCTFDPGAAARPTTAPAPLPAGYPPLPAGLPRAEVLRVIDGDTIAVRLDGREERVRFIGINTPESVDPRRPVECFGQEASANAKALLAGQTVLLEDDASQDTRDSNGRLLRYVWLEDGRMANLEQVAQGFAAEYTFSTPYKYRDQFRAAQRAAQDADLGLWSAGTCNGAFAPVGGAPSPNDRPAATAVRPASCPRLPEPAAAPEAPLQIVGLDKQAELVQLRNVGAEPVNLDGWLVCSQRGGESQGGIGGTLAPGETRAFTNPGSSIWSNSNRDDAALFDPSGQLVSYWEDR
jgi:micrococcal nuclease